MNTNHHDLLVALAEDVSFYDALRMAGYQPQSKSTLYEIMQKLNVAPQGNERANIQALREEAQRRGFQHHIYNFMHETEQRGVSERCCA